jgi:hypothetical protein
MASSKMKHTQTHTFFAKQAAAFQSSADFHAL